MDELNVTPQPEGENPQGDSGNPQNNQPTNPPADQGSFSLDQNQESTPAPKPTQPEGGVLGTSESEETMPGQNNPAQMEAQPEAAAQEASEEGDEDHPTVLEQAEDSNNEDKKKGGLPKWALIVLGVLGLAAVVGAVVYFTNPSLFQGQVRQIDNNLQASADEYCPDGSYWPGSQSNDIGMTLQSGHAQSLLDAGSVRETNFTLNNSSNTISAPSSTDEPERATIETVNEGSPTLTTVDEPLEAEVNYESPRLELETPDNNIAVFSPDQCVPINLNDCRTMSLLLGDTEKYKISPEYAEILKATYDKNCGSQIVTQDDCGENASADPTTGECTCDEGFFQIDEEEYTVDYAATSITYTRPICGDCDDLRIKITTLEKQRDGASNDEIKNTIQEEIDKLEKIAEENGCNPPEEQRTCEDVQADLDALQNQTSPTADELTQIANLQAEAAELGCEEPDDCGENQVRDENGDCMCDEENGYFDIFDSSNPNIRLTRICVDCEGLAERIKTMEDSMANLTDAQKAALQTEIDRLKAIQVEKGCNPPEEERTCRDVYADLAALDNNSLPPNDPTEVAQRTALEAEAAELGCPPPGEEEDCEDILAEIASLEAAPQLPPEESQRLAELKQLAERNQCEEPEEDPCEARIKEIQDLMDQGMYQDAYQKQLEYLASDCRGLEGCRAKLGRAMVAKSFLEFVQNDPVLTAYFQDEFDKYVNEYFTDPECNDRSCDELEGRLPLDENGVLQREPVEIVEEGRRESQTLSLANDASSLTTADTIRQQAEGSTLSLANDTTNNEGLTINNNLSSNDNNIIRLNNNTESSTLTINQPNREINTLDQPTREINTLSQSNLDRTIDEADSSDLLTDEEYYNRYCKTTLTVVKEVVNDDGGTLGVADFNLFIDQTAVTSGVANELAAGSYVVSEDAVAGYNGTITGDCDANGNVTLATQENKTCTIVNNDIGDPGEEKATLTVIKQVINNDGGTLGVSDFNLYVDQTAVTSGVSNEVSAGNHVVSEDSVAGYTGTIGGDCSANGNVTLAAGENKTCIIVNNDTGEPGQDKTTLTVVKQVINDDGKTLGVNDFNLYIDQNPVSSGVTNDVTPGSHVVSEDAVTGYSGTISGDCNANGNVTLAAGENKTCIIVNDDNTPGQIPDDPEFPPASPSDDPVIISETVITPPGEAPEQPELHGGAPEVEITESPEITKTGPEMYFFFFVFVASQVFYFRKKIYSLVENR